MAEPTHIGLDVHKETIAVAVLRPGTTTCDERVIPNTPEALRKLLGRFDDRAALRTCYVERFSGASRRSEVYRRLRTRPLEAPVGQGRRLQGDAASVCHCCSDAATASISLRVRSPEISTAYVAF